jgi:hypothetical protein
VAPRSAFALLLAVVGAGSSGTSARAEPAFDLLEIPSRGRTVAAEYADLDGDSRTDLLQIAFVGYPPDESRWLRVYLQDAGGALPVAPSFEWPLPEGAAAYDLADVDAQPGVELILLQPGGLGVLSLGGPELRGRTLPVPDPPTLALAADERGLDRLRIARSGLGPVPWLLVPQPDVAVALSPEGRVLARLEVGGVANYLVQPQPGPLVFESDVQVYFDAPRLSVADVAVNDRSDIVASSRHYLRLFLRRPDGSFATAPDRVIPLARVSERDHLRGSGAVRVDVGDLDGDGRADVLVSHIAGALTDSRTQTSIHLNRDAGWDLGAPDQSFESRGSWSSVELLDLDGDGRRELVRTDISFSLLELIEILVTRALDARISIHRRDANGGFEREPWLERKLDLPLSFETFRPRGFVPTIQYDLNADGHRDLVASGGGESIEVFLGGPEHKLDKRVARDEVDSRGLASFGDLDSDGLPDLVIYDPSRADAPVIVARNAGVLPGSPRRLQMSPAD